MAGNLCAAGERGCSPAMIGEADREKGGWENFMEEREGKCLVGVLVYIYFEELQ